MEENNANDSSKRKGSDAARSGTGGDSTKNRRVSKDSKDSKGPTDNAPEPMEDKVEKRKTPPARKTITKTSDAGDKNEEHVVSNPNPATPAPKKSVTRQQPGEAERKQIFRVSNANVSPIASNKGSPANADGDQRASRSTKDKGKDPTKNSTVSAPPPSAYNTDYLDEAEESEQSDSVEHDGMSLVGDIDLPSDSNEEESRNPGDAIQKKSRASMLKRKWNDISAEIRSTFDDPCRVYKLRGYHSEPNLSLPFQEKFDVRIGGAAATQASSKGLIKIREKFVSCEDIVINTTGKEHPELVRGVLSEIRLRSYAIDEKTKNAWRELVDLEKKRFSFFDELFAMGYVVDSLEVLSPPPKGEDGKPITQGEYFIEADERHYRKKVDYGRVVFKTKHVYTGNFTDWYFQGPGRYSWQDGTIYQGEFAHGLMHGPGSIHWPDGCVYEGHFINGIRTGWGVYSTADGYTFAGEWFKGLPHGHGKMWYDPDDDDNDYYEGQWETGLPQGVGTRQYATGDRYVGNWARGMRNGYGIMIWLQERQVYKGEWLDGVPHGFGKHIWYLERSPTSSFPTRHVYQGAWVLGRREGIGKMIYPCGSIYEGRWKNGQRHGKGMFINPAGDILIGLFRAGSILGGSEVPLHAPTYDCDYGGLTEWLTAKFSLTLIEGINDEESLHEVTKQYLPYIRKLYHRAGEYSQRYGNHGLYPAYMKKGTNTQARGHHHQNQNEGSDNQSHFNKANPHHRGYSKLDEPEHMKGKMEKPEALDGVNPVTRFGLWLLIRDCDNLLDEVTMAYYDKIWCETPPLSFQTRHNPFEPVYLWQFLQSLIVAAVAYYVDIPHLRKQTSDNVNEIPVEPAAVSEATLGSGVSPAEQRRAQLIRQRRAAQEIAKEAQYEMRKTVSKKGRGTDHHRKRKDSNMTAVQGAEEKRHHAKKAQSQMHQETVDPSKLPTDKDKDVRHSIDSKGKSGNQEQEQQKEKVQSNKSPVKPKAASVDYGLEALVGPPGSAGDETDEEEYSIEEEEEAEGLRNSVLDGELNMTAGRVPPVTISISECFETFLSEKLLPCLKREPGANLPIVPQPLPALVDMYDAFKAIKNRDILRGTEYLRSALPHLLFPNPNNAIWWHRCPESLSHCVDVEDMLEMYREKFSATEEESELEANWEDKLENEYLGAQAQNSETAIRILNLCKDNPASDECSPSADGEGRMSIPVGDSLLPDLKPDESVDELGTLANFVTEGHPFAEAELVPEPFLWADDYKCIPVPRKYQHFENINTHDVFNVLQQLYPGLCTEAHEKDLHFDLIFCDWLWCTSLLAKVSTEREFRDAWKVMSTDERPITNPQSLGVYVHHIKQIKNNPYLSTSPPPDFQPKMHKVERDEETTKEF